MRRTQPVAVDPHVGRDRRRRRRSRARAASQRRRAARAERRLGRPPSRGRASRGSASSRRRGSSRSRPSCTSFETVSRYARNCVGSLCRRARAPSSPRAAELRASIANQLVPPGQRAAERLAATARRRRRRPTRISRPPGNDRRRRAAEVHRELRVAGREVDDAVGGHRRPLPRRARSSRSYIDMRAGLRRRGRA